MTVCASHTIPCAKIWSKVMIYFLCLKWLSEVRRWSSPTPIKRKNRSNCHLYSKFNVQQASIPSHRICLICIFEIDAFPTPFVAYIWFLVPASALGTLCVLMRTHSWGSQGGAVEWVRMFDSPCSPLLLGRQGGLERERTLCSMSSMWFILNNPLWQA